MCFFFTYSMDVKQSLFLLFNRKCDICCRHGVVLMSMPLLSMSPFCCYLDILTVELCDSRLLFRLMILKSLVSCSLLKLFPFVCVQWRWAASYQKQLSISWMLFQYCFSQSYRCLTDGALLAGCHIYSAKDFIGWCGPWLYLYNSRAIFCSGSSSGEHGCCSCGTTVITAAETYH